jgi:hypothetical protein
MPSESEYSTKELKDLTIEEKQLFTSIEKGKKELILLIVIIIGAIPSKRKCRRSQGVGEKRKSAHKLPG